MIYGVSKRDEIYLALSLWLLELPSPTADSSQLVYVVYTLHRNTYCLPVVVTLPCQSVGHTISIMW
jgi:hypothetical protein